MPSVLIMCPSMETCPENRSKLYWSLWKFGAGQPNYKLHWWTNAAQLVAGYSFPYPSHPNRASGSMPAISLAQVQVIPCRAAQHMKEGLMWFVPPRLIPSSITNLLPSLAWSFPCSTHLLPRNPSLCFQNALPPPSPSPVLPVSTLSLPASIVIGYGVVMPVHAFASHASWLTSHDRGAHYGTFARLWASAGADAPAQEKVRIVQWLSGLCDIYIT